MKNVDLYGRVRHAVLIDGMSSREAARVFGVDPRTIAKMLAFSFPPGYRRSQPVRRPKLDAFTGIIDQTLEADKLVPKKQRHTSKRIFERLRDEHDFEGGITIVGICRDPSDYIFAAKHALAAASSGRCDRTATFCRIRRRGRSRRAQADFGEAHSATRIIYSKTEGAFRTFDLSWHSLHAARLA